MSGGDVVDTPNDEAGTSSTSLASLIHQASVTLTDAETKNLPTYHGGSELSISGAPSAGRIIVLDTDLRLAFYPALADYGNLDGLTVRITLAGGGGSGYLQVDTLLQTDFLSGYGGGAGTDFGAFHTVPGYTGFLEQTQTRGQIEALGLVIHGSSSATTPLTGGDPGNGLTFGFDFRVWDTTQKKFITDVESGWQEATRTFS